MMYEHRHEYRALDEGFAAWLDEQARGRWELLATAVVGAVPVRQLVATAGPQQGVPLAVVVLRRLRAVVAPSAPVIAGTLPFADVTSPPPSPEQQEAVAALVARDLAEHIEILRQNQNSDDFAVSLFAILRAHLLAAMRGDAVAGKSSPPSPESRAMDAAFARE